jgi:hypothetical protein
MLTIGQTDYDQIIMNTLLDADHNSSILTTRLALPRHHITDHKSKARLHSFHFQLSLSYSLYRHYTIHSLVCKKKNKKNFSVVLARFLILPILPRGVFLFILAILPALPKPPGALQAIVSNKLNVSPKPPS